MRSLCAGIAQFAQRALERSPVAWIARHVRAYAVPSESLHRRNSAIARFLDGPVPLAWLETAAKLPGRSLHVGLVLWYAAGSFTVGLGSPEQHFVPCALALTVTPSTERLLSLEGAGLVSGQTQARPITAGDHPRWQRHAMTARQVPLRRRAAAHRPLPRCAALPRHGPQPLQCRGAPAPHRNPHRHAGHRLRSP